MNVPVVYFITTDRRSVDYAAYSIHTLRGTNPDFAPYVYTDTPLSDSDRRFLLDCNPNSRFFDLKKYCLKFGVDERWQCRKWPYFLWLRPLIHEFDELKDVDKIVYSDNEVEYLGSLDRLMTENISDFDCIGFCDYLKKDVDFLPKAIKKMEKAWETAFGEKLDYRLKNGYCYMNAGFYVLNLKRLRSSKKNMLKYVRKGPEFFPLVTCNEQDFLNCVYKIKYFNNYDYNTALNEKAVVRHYYNPYKSMYEKKLETFLKEKIGRVEGDLR